MEKIFLEKSRALNTDRHALIQLEATNNFQMISFQMSKKNVLKNGVLPVLQEEKGKIQKMTTYVWRDLGKVGGMMRLFYSL